MKTRLEIVSTHRGPLEYNVQYCMSNTIVHTITYKQGTFQDRRLMNLASC
jgi:hypothetical protein